MFDLSTISKAIAAGLTTAVVAELARYGFQVHPATVTALGIVLTAVVGYVVGHVAVYLAPKNTTKQ